MIVIITIIIIIIIVIIVIIVLVIITRHYAYCYCYWATGPSGCLSLLFLTARGKTLGTAAGNVFSAVGNRVIKAPEMRFDNLDSELKDLANELGDEALVVGSTLQGVARTTVEARYKLALHLLAAATEVYNKAKEIANQVARTVTPENLNHL